MEDLLFLAHRIPYPPNKGDKIRSWNILRHLTERYRVHLGCFVDDPEDWRYEKQLRKLCGDCLFVPLHPVRAKITSAGALLTGAPLTLAYYRSAAMSRWTRALKKRVNIQRVFVFSSAMAQFVPQGDSDCHRLVIDFVDVDSDKWAQYAERKSFPANWIYRREARTLAKFEHRMAEKADASLLVSEAEAELFRSLVPSAADRVFALNNGVDFDFFDPDETYADPYGKERQVLVFTGQMDYWANVDAVNWFAEDMFPMIRDQVPGAQFWIVGANPSPEVSRLKALPGVHVTGRVPDIRPYLQHARTVVAPIRVARGVQNKVLEAMAMAKSVIATPEAADGISANPNTDIVVAAGLKEFVAAVIKSLRDQDESEMGAIARKTVISKYSWATNLTGLNEFLETPAL